MLFLSDFHKRKGSKLFSEEEKRKAFRYLNLFLTKYSSEVLKYANSRYKFILSDIIGSSGIEVIYKFKIIPNREGNLNERGDKTLYASPKKAMEEIVPIPGLIYRGMSFEEYTNMKLSGLIASKGSYNIGEGQKGLTFFSISPQTAMSYANGFAPWQYAATHNKPGVVIGVDEQGCLTDKDNIHIGSGECAFDKPMPISKIKKTYFLIVDTISHGFIEIIVDVWREKTGRPFLMEGSRHSPLAYYKIVEK